MDWIGLEFTHSVGGVYLPSHFLFFQSKPTLNPTQSNSTSFLIDHHHHHHHQSKWLKCKTTELQINQSIKTNTRTLIIFPSLIIKPSPGKIQSLFKKLTKINEKNGPFDLMICISDLFNLQTHTTDEEEKEIQDLIQNQIHIPIRTLFMIGQNPLPDSIQSQLDQTHGQVCENLEYLDPYHITTFKTLDNLRIATFSGIFDPLYFNPSDQLTQSSKSDPILNYIKSQTLSDFLKKFTPQSSTQPIDLLLTHALPQSLTTHSNRLPKDSNPFNRGGASPITQVLKTIQPKYHFSGAEDQFWEREPWVWDSTIDSNQIRLTRFINLGQFGNQTKERWFYAFNLTPNQGTRISKPIDSTPSPYSLSSGSQKRGFQEDDLDSGPNFRFTETDLTKRVRTNLPPSNYVCKICEKSGHWIQDCSLKKDDSKSNLQDGYVCRICHISGHRIQQCPMKDIKNSNPNRNSLQPKEIEPSTCWFCLSNPQVTKHLIASIGSETYLSLPKGPLPDPDSKDGVPGGGHVLIIPIAHYPSLLALPHEFSRSIQNEIRSYQSALRTFYSKYDCELVSFEICKLMGIGSRQGHGHLQVCPIPNALVSKVEEGFRSEGRLMGIEFEEEKEEEEEEEEGKEDGHGNGREGISYFRVGLPGGKGLRYWIKAHERFNMQFGRIVLAKVLGLPERWDWKSCVTKEEDEERKEREMCEEFQREFKEFEPKFD
ncbi:CwfJ C-terminus 1-domain-containing protein-like protein [Melampsora americana]|nr:CwfJ C-terminus 1-domain-containing protein-like protein [Melampsora americana]